LYVAKRTIPKVFLIFLRAAISEKREKERELQDEINEVRVHSAIDVQLAPNSW